MNTETVKLSQITANAANPRQIKDEKFTKLVNSILVFPKMLEIRPVVVDDAFVSLGGNMRYRALTFIAGMSIDDICKRLGEIRDYEKKTAAEKSALISYWEKWIENPTASIIKASELSEAEKKEFIIKDNNVFGEWDFDMLAGDDWDSENLNDWGVDTWQDTGGDDEGGATDNPGGVTLTDRFVVPPFSVLDTRKGYWQERKSIWRKIIGDMGESRNDTLIQAPELKYKGIYQRTRKHRETLGIGFAEYLEKYVSDEDKERASTKVLSHGVSILDPVLSEIVCRWFNVDGGKVFDCFAGDTVFGYVAAHLGYDFTGIELRKEQVELNNKRVENLPARYICDDGQNVAKHIEADSQDLLFSCPPYFDLEKYSNNVADASNQKTYAGFIGILKNAFTSALSCLKNDRFAIIVVGDVRDKKTGFYYTFADDVKQIFNEAGARLYNELILVETGASSALRAAHNMKTRKVVKMHQNVLCFYKGNPKNIKKHFKSIEYASEDLELFRMDFGDESGNN
ncbi:MAG: site-specific DNA-methyltransferase [Prevotellaceae bacterium]|jgi:DNA modification methylase|nr:site-specific DNA-methyltransferase [Prevotellaceae bacterium]